MSLYINPLRSTLALCLLLIGVSVAQAVPASESLLPNSTKGFVSVTNVDALQASWEQTQFGQMMNDPVMQPFAEDFSRQLQQRWLQTHRKLGLSWEDLEGVPTGEVAVAVMLPAQNQTAMALLADVTGNEQLAANLLEKVSRNLAAQRGRRSERTAFGTTMMVFDLPAQGEIPAGQAAFFLKDGLLGAADDVRVLEGILARMAGKAADSLEALPAFSGVMQRAQAAAGELVPHVRWFIEPFGYADIARLNSTEKRRRGTDMLKVLRDQGFTAVRGLGGYVNFAVNNYEILHRTAIYAPPIKQGEAKYELAARMLDFPNGGPFEPQPWVPRELAKYISFNWDMQQAFEASKTLVNQIVGDEVFEDVLESIEIDPNGPQLDIREELIGLLGQRATIISDYVLPITPKSERRLYAFETTNEQGIAQAVEKWMRSDPDAKRREFNGYVIWEIVDEEAAGVPMVTIENDPGARPGRKRVEEEEEDGQVLPNMAVTVAHGHLMVASHIDFLVKVLANADDRNRLSRGTDYQLVSQELERLAPAEVSGKSFARTDEEYRAVFELVRTGRMPEAETMLGKVLNALLGEGKEGVLRPQRIEGSKLPEFEAVRRYFGPAGAVMTTERDGWFIQGIVLSKDVPTPE